MFDLQKVPFKVLVAAEKAIGKNILALSQKTDKTFEDLRDFAFVVKYCQDQTFTLDKADALTISDIAELNQSANE
jgi:uncharacterized protein YgfB (UPF0149 family)